MDGLEFYILSDFLSILKNSKKKSKKYKIWFANTYLYENHVEKKYIIQSTSTYLYKNYFKLFGSTFKILKTKMLISITDQSVLCTVARRYGGIRSLGLTKHLPYWEQVKTWSSIQVGWKAVVCLWDGQEYKTTSCNLQDMSGAQKAHNNL